jgi:hypothetical protein
LVPSLLAKTPIITPKQKDMKTFFQKLPICIRNSRDEAKKNGRERRKDT